MARLTEYRWLPLGPETHGPHGVLTLESRILDRSSTHIHPFLNGRNLVGMLEECPKRSRWDFLGLFRNPSGGKGTSLCHLTLSAVCPRVELIQLREEVMSWLRKMVVVKITLLTLIEMATWTDLACAQTPVYGYITHVFADPGDFVIALNKNGSCGSHYFHVRRTNVNFKQMVDLTLTTFDWTGPMVLIVTGCAGTRNIISHGWAAHPVLPR
jgi:hypothetical protein